MVIRAARYELYAVFKKPFCHCRRDHMHQRSALRARKHRLVDRLCILLFAHDHAAARTAQGLVRSRRYKVRIRHGRRVQARRNEPRDMGDIHKHIRADFIAYFSDPLKVDDPGICARARNDHLRLAFEGDLLHFVIVDRLGIPAHAVGNDIKIRTRKIDGRAVRQMSAVRKVHTHNGIARFQYRKIDGKVCLRPAVRLYVAVLAPEHFL